MKVLFLSSWYPTVKNPNLGVFVKEHAQSIHGAGNEIVVLGIVIHRSTHFFSKQITDSFDEKGIRTVLIEINTRYRDMIYHAIPLQFHITKKIFKKNIKPQFEPDIVHSNVIFPAGIIANWLAKYLKKPHLITEHWTRVRNFREMPVLSFWAKKAYHNSTRIMPVSGFLQNEIMESFEIKDPNKFRIVGNVINPEIFFFKEKNHNPNELRLCAIATWAHLKHPAKQPELLINALSEVQKEINRSIYLTMIGGGDKVDELKELCKEKNVDALFTGYLNKATIASKLQESDFFVHPTTIETFGVVVAEALLTGTPVICSNVSALKELINEENGILCDNTIDDWKRAIKEGLKTKFDRKKISEDIQKKYDMNSIGEAINKVYQEISLNRH